MHHELKIWPQFFCRVLDGTKTFEVRDNDRGFQPGDTVVLREWDPKVVTKHDDDPMGGTYNTEPRGYTGKTSNQMKVGYVLPIEGNRVVFSLLPDGGHD